jgi:hypothetical protein
MPDAADVHIVVDRTPAAYSTPDSQTAQSESPPDQFESNSWVSNLAVIVLFLYFLINSISWPSIDIPTGIFLQALLFLAAGIGFAFFARSLSVLESTRRKRTRSDDTPGSDDLRGPDVAA